MGTVFALLFISSCSEIANDKTRESTVARWTSSEVEIVLKTFHEKLLPVMAIRNGTAKPVLLTGYTYGLPGALVPKDIKKKLVYFRVERWTGAEWKKDGTVGWCGNGLETFEFEFGPGEITEFALIGSFGIFNYDDERPFRVGVWVDLMNGEPDKIIWSAKIPMPARNNH